MVIEDIIERIKDDKQIIGYKKLQQRMVQVKTIEDEYYNIVLIKLDNESYHFDKKIGTGLHADKCARSLTLK